MSVDFREYIKRKYLKPSDRILEFGPLTRPTVYKETHPGIRFADVRSTEDIKKLYTANDYLKSTGVKVDIDSIVDIDYVVKGSYKESFRGVKKFDAVLLSHVIEHMTDIISFFEDVKNIIAKDGHLILIYPDARYCFDHFRNGTTFIDAYDVYKNKKNSSNRVLDFVYNVVHENNPFYFWNDPKKANLLPKNDFHAAIEAYEKALKGELPDDTHFWPFADHQFVKFLYDMDRAGLLDFDIEDFHQTQENTQEFMIILTPKKKNVVDYEKYKKILNKISPSVKEAKARQQISSLSEELALLKDENERINGELQAIYNSKKWKYLKKAANVKNKLTGRNGEK